VPGSSRLRCSRCDRPGNGRCATCQGTGQNLHLNAFEPKCDRCAGTGACKFCDGSGYPRSSDLFESGVPRTTVVSANGRVEVIIRAPWIGVAIFFLPVWLAGWAFGEYHVGIEIIQGKATLLEYIWFVGWSAGGIGALYSLMWMLVGRERVAIDGLTLSIRDELGPLGRAKRFDANKVHNLRCSPVLVTSPTATPPGTIAFEYGPKTYRFGSGIGEAEANDLVRVLKERIPSG
jgi:hypothetical protein